VDRAPGAPARLREEKTLEPYGLGPVRPAMPPSIKSPRAPSSAPRGEVPPLPVPVHCSGEGCDAKTTFVLMGEREGYEGGLFEDPGWTIGTTEDFDDSGGSFICQKCFEKEQEAGHVTRD
jgi:hypothetical protein